MGELYEDITTDSDAFYPTLANTTSGTWTTPTVSSTKLYFNPATGTLNATIFNSLSDEMAKTNIVTLSNALTKTISLRGVSYTLKESGKNQIGVIAQEIEKVIPEVVSTSKDGVKSVSYGNIIGILIEAIKELNTEINDLKQRISDGQK